jgi:hypothetical protein
MCPRYGRCDFKSLPKASAGSLEAKSKSANGAFTLIGFCKYKGARETRAAHAVAVIEDANDLVMMV